MSTHSLTLKRWVGKSCPAKRVAEMVAKEGPAALGTHKQPSGGRPWQRRATITITVEVDDA